MAGGVDETSRVLGSLEADAKTAQRQRTEIFNQLGDIQKTLACLPGLAETVRQHADVIKDYEKTKNRGIGAAIALVTGGGGVGAAVALMLKKMGLQ